MRLTCGRWVLVWALAVACGDVPGELHPPNSIADARRAGVSRHPDEPRWPRRRCSLEYVSQLEPHHADFVGSFDYALSADIRNDVPELLGNTIQPVVANGSLPGLVDRVGEALQLLVDDQFDPQRKTLTSIASLANAADAHRVVDGHRPRRRCAREPQPAAGAALDPAAHAGERWRRSRHERRARPGDPRRGRAHEHVHGPRARRRPGHAAAHRLASSTIRTTRSARRAGWCGPTSTATRRSSSMPSTGKLPAPFVDLDGDGAADVGTTGRPIDAAGNLIDLPYLGARRTARPARPRAQRRTAACSTTTTTSSARRCRSRCRWAPTSSRPSSITSSRAIADAVLGAPVVCHDGTTTCRAYAASNHPLADLSHLGLELLRFPEDVAADGRAPPAVHHRRRQGRGSARRRRRRDRRAPELDRHAHRHRDVRRADRHRPADPSDLHDQQHDRQVDAAPARRPDREHVAAPRRRRSSSRSAGCSSTSRSPVARTRPRTVRSSTIGATASTRTQAAPGSTTAAASSRRSSCSAYADCGFIGCSQGSLSTSCVAATVARRLVRQPRRRHGLRVAARRDVEQVAGDGVEPDLVHRLAQRVLDPVRLQRRRAARSRRSAAARRAPTTRPRTSRRSRASRTPAGSTGCCRSRACSTPSTRCPRSSTSSCYVANDLWKSGEYDRKVDNANSFVRRLEPPILSATKTGAVVKMLAALDVLHGIQVAGTTEPATHLLVDTLDYAIQLRTVNTRLGPVASSSIASELLEVGAHDQLARRCGERRRRAVVGGRLRDAVPDGDHHPARRPARARAPQHAHAARHRARGVRRSVGAPASLAGLLRRPLPAHECRRS